MRPLTEDIPDSTDLVSEVDAKLFMDYLKENLTREEWRLVFLITGGFTQKQFGLEYNLSKQAVSAKVQKLRKKLAKLQEKWADLV